MDQEGSKDARRDQGCSVAKRQSQIQDLCFEAGGTLPRDGSKNSSSAWLINQGLASLLRDLQAQELTALAQELTALAQLFRLTGSCDAEHTGARVVAADSTVRSRGTAPGVRPRRSPGVSRQQEAPIPHINHWQ